MFKPDVMKKAFEIFSIVLLCAMIGAVVWCCSDDDDDNDEIAMGYDQLPEAAKTFISTYYGGVQVSRIEKDIELDGLEFEVYFANGHEVTFNSQGEWTDVDAPFGQSVPAGIVPEAISDYISANYPDSGVNEISRLSGGYEVELLDGVELLFDTTGNFTGFGRH